MAIEIERKFLVKDSSYKIDATSCHYRQGYLCPGTGVTARIRIAGEKAFLTIKGRHAGISKIEFEYPIPVKDAEVMLSTMCQNIISKQRYRTEYNGFTWEIDEFFGDNEGLILAEIELESVEQKFSCPPWLGNEVSDDGRYYNASLSLYPYRDWKNS